MKQTSQFIELEGGTFHMGSENPKSYQADGEGPVREVFVDSFSISATAVTNEEFSIFVNETSYITTAEKEGWSFVFSGHLPIDFPDTRGVVGAEWWRQVHNADWKKPEGPNSHIDDRQNHPVVHVSWFDAVAFAEWAGGRLPTEAEWEFAARGGLDQSELPWGNDLMLEGEHRCNIWTGTFPNEDTAEDGYAGTCPVDAFKPNRFGIFNCSGNVWEWCSDWFSTQFGNERPLVNPKGAKFGTHRVIKGGSFLCHDSYCHRYRVGARSSTTPDSSTGHQGIRLAH